MYLHVPFNKTCSYLFVGSSLALTSYVIVLSVYNSLGILLTWLYNPSGLNGKHAYELHESLFCFERSPRVLAASFCLSISLGSLYFFVIWLFCVMLMCIYIYIYIYVYICIHTCVYIYIYIILYIYIYYITTAITIYTYVDTCRYMYIYIYIYTRVCVYIYIYYVRLFCYSCVSREVPKVLAPF